MKLPIDTNDERGQVGIGTLIIFIAMVLVAAVAAGVLVNTSGMLQQTASSTGEDAQAQVTNQVSVVNAVGQTNNDSEVSEVTFTLAKSAGSDPIDLEETSIQYVSADNNEMLSSASAVVSLTDLSDTEVSGSDAILRESGDRLQITLTLDGSTLNELQEGDEATVHFVDQSGAKTTYRIDAPDTLFAQENVEV